MSRSLNKTLLIVCEGTVSEPNYFASLKKFVPKDLDYKITITPKPRLEQENDEELKHSPVEQTGKRKKRKIKVTSDEPEYEFMPQEGFNSQPVSYVWEAREGLKNGNFDEVWAVYDKDGHPNHQQALDIANEGIQGEKINIAFSSIAFEVWILLHFELNTTAFEKSQCRTGKNDLHKCGQNIDHRDCKGIRCVTGRLKSEKYINNEVNIKNIPYSEISLHTNQAILHALEIRRKLYNNNNELTIFELNPYTSVDRLAFKILHLSRDYKWINTNDISLFGDHIGFTLNGSIMTLTYVNTGSKGTIIKEDSLRLVNIKGEENSILSSVTGYYEPDKSFTLDIYLDEYKEFAPKYISVALATGINGIAEIPFTS